MIESELTDETEVIETLVCQGPPKCMLEGDEAMAAQKAGCPWCDRFIFDGETETAIKPGNA